MIQTRQATKAATVNKTKPTTRKATLRRTRTQTKTTKKRVSPFEVTMRKLQTISKQQKAIEHLVIRDVAKPIPKRGCSKIGGKEGKNFDRTRCTRANVDHFRAILITQDRQKCLDEMKELVLGREFNAQATTTSTKPFSEHVAYAWDKAKDLFLEQPSWKKEFELLLAFTIVIFQHDSWIRDDGDDKKKREVEYYLGSWWRSSLKKTNKDLGIDDEFTRPGVVALLEDLEGKMNSSPAFAGLGSLV